MAYMYNKIKYFLTEIRVCKFYNQLPVLRFFSAVYKYFPILSNSLILRKKHIIIEIHLLLN
jgi:hypothetical protein